jgi:signal transduction histidine kinase/ActR/RegA family two-component response regulator
VRNSALSDPILLSSILAVLPEGIFLCTGEKGENRVLYANQAAAAILSCTMDDLIDQPLRQCLAKRLHDERIDEKLSQAIERNHTETVQIENHDKGVVSWVSLKLDPLGDYFLCRLDTLCDQKINEMRLAEAHKLEALGQLAGGVAHDFNNVLSIIEGYARMAAKELVEQPEVGSYIEKIKQSVKRGAGLTRQLLAFGRKNIVPEAIYDLSNLVIDHEALFKPLLDASMTLHIECGKEIFIECAPDAISQILMNVIVNARDAMPSGGHIYLNVSEHKRLALKGTTGDYACISVRDTGTGMDSETKRRIFDPFFTTKPHDKGTGLGMSMVYGLVEQMKGAIDIQSESGKGTIINLYFPLSHEKQKRQIRQIDNGMGGSVIRLDGYTALIAEDEPDLLTLVATMLGDMGMNVITAANGNEALARQEDYDGQIDFLVTDVVMPEMNGIKLSELFTSLRPDSKTLFISGYPASGNMARIELPQGAHLLSKPVAYDCLAYILRDLAEEDTQEGLLRMAGEVIADVG